MLQIRSRLDLAQEPLGADDGRQLGAQHLDGDVAIVLEVVRQVDRRHTARAELALDAIPIGEACGQAEEVVVHLWGRSSARALYDRRGHPT